jgi:hypothetical protein
VCEKPVTKDELEGEIEFAREVVPELDNFHVHVRCFAAWGSSARRRDVKPAEELRRYLRVRLADGRLFAARGMDTVRQEQAGHVISVSGQLRQPRWSIKSSALGCWIRA